MAILFVHHGNSPYLDLTLRQARASDPDAEIVLLGDPSNNRFPFVQHVDSTSAPYRTAGAEVARVYQHMSTNAPATALRWLERWFWLRTWVRETGQPVVTLDSDVLLFASEAEIWDTVGRATFAGCRPAEQAPYRWTLGPCVTAWAPDAVEAFCDFALRSYTDPLILDRYRAKWSHHQETGQPGGVIDMTTLFLFAETLSPDDFTNLVEVERGATCDLNLNTAENLTPGEYALDGDTKAIQWVGDQPIGHNVRLGADVRFQALHLQGHAKRFLPAYYHGPSFPGQRAVERSLRIDGGVRRVGARVLGPWFRWIRRRSERGAGDFGPTGTR